MDMNLIRVFHTVYLERSVSLAAGKLGLTQSAVSHGLQKLRKLFHDISRRLKDRILFGADYPLFRYEKLFEEWRAEGYSEDVLDGLFTKNAERFLASVGVAA